MMPIVMPMLMNACTPNQTAMPTATSMPNWSSALAAMRRQRSSTIASSTMMIAQPTNPSSSPATEKMKSVCCSGTKLPRTSGPWNRPSPNRPPDPMPIFDWYAL